MSTTRTFSVLLKNRNRPPVHASDVATAREALAQEAEYAGYILTGDVRLTHQSYAEVEDLHICAYSSRGTPCPFPVHGSPHANHPGLPSTQAATMAFRAHRTPLHSMQVITGAVETALEPREDPKEAAKAALVALHLLRMPVDSGRNALIAGSIVRALFEPPKKRLR